MIRSIIILIAVLIAACDSPKRENTRNVISQDSLNAISNQWKFDSLGCSRRRDPEKIRALISQLELMGKDSSVIIKYLGTPQEKSVRGNTTIFCYYMSCKIENNSGYIFCCSFEDSKMVSAHEQIIN